MFTNFSALNNYNFLTVGQRTQKESTMDYFSQRTAKELDIRNRELSLAEQRLALDQQRFQLEMKKYDDAQQVREERARADRQHAAMMQLLSGLIEAIKK